MIDKTKLGITYANTDALTIGFKCPENGNYYVIGSADLDIYGAYDGHARIVVNRCFCGGRHIFSTSQREVAENAND